MCRRFFGGVLVPSGKKTLDDLKVGLAEPVAVVMKEEEMSPKQIETHVKERIVLLKNLQTAAEEVNECAEPIYASNDNSAVEYVIDAEAFERMVECLNALGPKE